MKDEDIVKEVLAKNMNLLESGKEIARLAREDEGNQLIMNHPCPTECHAEWADQVWQAGYERGKEDGIMEEAFGCYDHCVESARVEREKILERLNTLNPDHYPCDLLIKLQELIKEVSV